MEDDSPYRAAALFEWNRFDARLSRVPVEFYRRWTVCRFGESTIFVSTRCARTQCQVAGRHPKRQGRHRFLIVAPETRSARSGPDPVSSPIVTVPWCVSLSAFLLVPLTVFRFHSTNTLSSHCIPHVYLPSYFLYFFITHTRAR